MIIVIQNLQKIAGLASILLEEYEPDILLAQEINLRSEESKEPYNIAHNTSKIGGYGTAIFGRKELSDVRLVDSPHKECGGFVVKKTTVATYDSIIQLVSFHGYNGQPFKSISKLIDHVRAVLAVVNKDGAAIFAGDFNTWTPLHVEAVHKELEDAGFEKAFSWPYPGRVTPLDHAFIRGLRLKVANHFGNASDHRGAVLELAVSDG